MVNMRAGLPRLGTVCDEYRLVNRRLMEAGRGWSASAGWIADDPDRVDGRRSHRAVLIVQRLIP